MKGLNVDLIPLEEHHQDYCSDEIEIFEVRRLTNLTFSCNLNPIILEKWSPSSSSLNLLIQDKVSHIDQLEKFNGGSITPSSLILSRFLLSNKFQQMIEEKKQEINSENIFCIDLSKIIYFFIYFQNCLFIYFIF